jgi:hypothetical protein
MTTNEDQPGQDPDSYEQVLTDAMAAITPQYARAAVEQLPADIRLETTAALRKPSFEKTDEVSTSWANLAGQTADDAMLEQGDASDWQHVFHFYSLTAAATASSIDYIKRKSMGADSSTKISNVIIAMTLDKLAQEMVQKHHQVLSNNKNLDMNTDWLMRILLNDQQQYIAWKGIKLSIFWSGAGDYLGMANVLNGMQSAPEDSPETMKVENDALFNSTSVLQKYGVKSAIAPSRMGNRNVKEWLIESTRDARLAREQLNQSSGTSRPSPYEQMRQSIATFRSTDQSFTTSKLRHNFVGSEAHPTVHGEIVDMTDLIAPVDADKQMPDAGIKLGTDGELYSVLGSSIKALLYPRDYETLRAEILCLYTDLVVPVYVTELFDVEAQGDSIGASPSTAGRMRCLVLARERVLRLLGDDIITQLDNEQTKAQREMAEHDVIGHVRHLPSTYRASQAARELCQKDIGVVLAEYGETYVQDHRRGTVKTEETGHKVIFKNAASVAIKASMNAGPSKNTNRKKQKRRK